MRKKNFNIEIDQENYVDSHLSKLQRNFIFFLLKYIALQICQYNELFVWRERSRKDLLCCPCNKNH